MKFFDKWNKGNFSIYKSEEKTVLKLIENINNFIGKLSQGVDNKTDLHGDHKGSWQGLNRPTLSEEGMRATVEQLIDETIPGINSEMEQLIDETIPGINSEMEQKANLSYIENDIFKVVKNTDNIDEIMNNENVPLRLLKGVYEINKPLKFKNSFEGVGLGDVIIRPSDNFVGDFLIDFAEGSERKYIKNLTFDMNYKNISAFSSSVDGSGSSASLFENIWFIQGGTNKYVIDAHSESTVSGMLTGSTFLNCHFNGNGLWCNIGNNQDDINFINCRFGMDGLISNKPMFRSLGTNIKFDCCYFGITSTDYEIGGVKPLFDIGMNITKFQNCLFESYGESNITSLIFCSFPNCNISMDTIHFNLIAPQFRSLFRFGIGSTTSEISFISVENITGRPNFPLNSSLLELFNGVQDSTKKVKLKFSNVDIFNNLILQANSSYSIDKNVELNGIFKGENLTNSFKTTIITPEKTNSFTVTKKLPSQGIWIVNVVAKATNDINHSITGTYIINYLNNVYKILSSDPIGNVQKSNTPINITGLDVNVTSDGNLNITVNFEGTYVFGVDIKGTKLISF